MQLSFNGTATGPMYMIEKVFPCRHTWKFYMFDKVFP
jgi:hypothetical protein